MAIVGLSIAGAVAAPKLTRAWLANKLAAELAVEDVPDPSSRLRALAELDEPGIEVLVNLLADERPDISGQALATLVSAQGSWQLRSAEEAERLQCCLVTHLENAWSRLPDEKTELAVTLLGRTLEDCVVAETAAGQDAFRQATALVQQLQTVDFTRSDVGLPPLQVAKYPVPQLRPVPQSASTPASSLENKLRKTPAPTNRDAATSVLATAAKREATPLPAASESASPVKLRLNTANPRLRNEEARSDNERGEQEPADLGQDGSLTLRPPQLSATSALIRPIAAPAERAPRAQHGAIQTGGVASLSVDVTPIATPAADSGTTMSAAPSTAKPEKLVRTGAAVHALGRLEMESGFGGTLAPYSDREVIDLVGSRQEHLVQIAIKELQARGFTAAEIELAPQLSADLAARMELVQILPHRADFDPRRWLQWLADDPERDVRQQAISMLATMDDPAIRRWLARKLSDEKDPIVAQQIRQRLRR